MKIAITARNFRAYDTCAIEKLQEDGHEVIDYSEAGMGTGTDEDTVFQAVRGADIAIAGLEPYGKALLEKCPKLQMISLRGIGYDSVDLKTCESQGITVSRTVGTVEGSVAEQVIAYILYFPRRIDLQSQLMHSGQWKRILVQGAKNRTLGLVGFGGIGKEIAERALPLGMKIIYYCRHPQKEWESDFGATFMEMDDLLAVSDYVSVNVPLTEDTKNMFDFGTIMKIQKGGCVINISRGAIVDPYALKRVLDLDHLSGAAIDVFDGEPCTDSPLIDCGNAILTPHTAPYTEEKRERKMSLGRWETRGSCPEALPVAAALNVTAPQKACR